MSKKNTSHLLLAVIQKLFQGKFDNKMLVKELNNKTEAKYLASVDLRSKLRELKT